VRVPFAFFRVQLTDGSRLQIAPVPTADVSPTRQHRDRKTVQRLKLLLTKASHDPQTLLSGAIGAFCAVAGLYASYYLHASSGATIVLLVTVLFFIGVGGRAARFLIAPRALPALTARSSNSSMPAPPSRSELRSTR
jgi:hypothetical protein